MDRKLEKASIDATISLLKKLHLELMAHKIVVIHFESQGVPLGDAVEKARHNEEIRKAIENKYDNLREKLMVEMDESDRQIMIQGYLSQWNPTDLSN